MHDPEKSDSGIVATKPTNKAGRPVAEPVEPRPGTKGNADQQSTHRAQSRARVTQALGRVRLAARQRKKEQFTALLHHINVDTLRTAFYALKRKAAPGVDGMTWQDYEADLELRIEDLHGRVHRGAYQLRDIKAELRRRMHQPIPEQGKWLRQVVAGHFAYYAVPTNSRALSAFRHYVTDLWRRTLRRRSQKGGFTWERMTRLVADWLPPPRILHPWPDERFDVRHLR